MERWRRRALEAFPELQQELTGADDTIAAQILFLVKLREMGLVAADEGNADLVRRISDYVEWLDQVPILRVTEPEPEYKPFPTEGYIVVHSGEAHIRQFLRETHEYQSRTTKTSVSVPLEDLETDFKARWETLGVDPTAYRGMGRMCLCRDSDVDDGDETDKAGRVRLLELVGDDLYRGAGGYLDDNYALLASVEQAEEVRLLLDTPTDWETIGVSQVTSTRNTRTLGFDIGWWDPEYYSLISDCIVAPTAHGPPEDDWSEVASQATALNQHLLFDTVEDVLRFRDWYTIKDWAEEGPPDFVAVRIDTAS